MMRPRQEKQTAKRWTPEDESMLRDLAERNTPTREIGLRLDRRWRRRFRTGSGPVTCQYARPVLR
jgi:hypothetical protein